mgnify:CR=1 FL=1
MENRYSRQLKVPGIGSEGQKRLEKSSVLIIGCGGLGCPCALSLSRAGIGRIGLVDADTISFSNLHRQTLFVERDVDSFKVDVAKERLLEGNSACQIDSFNTRFTTSNYQELLNPYDIIIDATDNFETRYLINDACVAMYKPLVYGAANQTEGQLAVFNLNESGQLRDLFPEFPEVGTIQNCEEAGVLGPITGIIGDLMAMEVIKIITSIGEPLTNQLVQFNGLDTSFHRIRYKKLEGHKESVLNIKEPLSISWDIFRKRYERDYILVDVRTIEERETQNLGGKHIPLDELGSHIKKTTSDKFVFYCKSGQRARKACLLVEQLDIDAMYIQ